MNLESSSARSPPDLNIYWALVACFCLLGLGIALLVPLFLIPDEKAHWQQGHVRTERLLGHADNGCIPTVILDDWLQLEPTRSRQDRRPPQGRFESIASMPLVCPDPRTEYGDVLTYPGVVASKLILHGQTKSAVRQVQGIWLTRVLQGLMLLICLVHLGQLVKGTGRASPLILAAAALSPLFAQQAFGVSSDGVTLCFGISMFSVIMFWEKLGALDLALFFFFGWGAIARPFVLPCMLPSVVIGFWYAQLRAGKLDSAGPLSCARDIIGACRPRHWRALGTYFLWGSLALTLMAVVLALFNLSSVNVERKIGIDTPAQLAFLKANPGWIFTTLFPSLWPDLFSLRAYLGPLGWLDASLSDDVVQGFGRVFAIAFLLQISFIVAKGRRRGSEVRRGSLKRLSLVLAPVTLGLAAVAATLFVVIFVLYLRWTPVGLSIVHGFQARYIFPPIMLLIGVVTGAIEIVAGAPSPATMSDAQKIASRTSTMLAARLPPMLILAVTLPFLIRVFMDIFARYY